MLLSFCKLVLTLLVDHLAVLEVVTDIPEKTSILGPGSLPWHVVLIVNVAFLSYSEFLLQG